MWQYYLVVTTLIQALLGIVCHDESEIFKQHLGSLLAWGERTEGLLSIFVVCLMSMTMTVDGCHKIQFSSFRVSKFKSFNKILELFGGMEESSHRAITT